MGILDRIGLSGGHGESGTAVVLDSTPYANVERPGVVVGEEIADNDLWYLNLGKRPHELRLEVRFPGQPPYELTGRFRVPARLTQGSGVRLPSGVELPIRRTGDGAEDFEIDWKMFASTPQAKREFKRHAKWESNDRLVEGLERSQPDVQAKMFASNTAALPTWVAAVKSGSLKRKQFDASTQTLIRLKQIDPEALAAAVRELDGLS